MIKWLENIIDELKSNQELRQRFILVKLDCFEILNNLNKYIHDNLRKVEKRLSPLVLEFTQKREKSRSLQVKTTISQTKSGSQVQEDTEGSQALDKFIKIFGQFEQSQDGGDNISQFSDFSFHFDHLSRSNEDFFDF